MSTRQGRPVIAWFGLGSAIALLAGVLAAQRLEALPSMAVSAGTTALALLVALRWPRSRLVALVVLGFAWAAWRGAIALDVRIPQGLEGRDLRVQGRVVDLPRRDPDALRFELVPSAVEHADSTDEAPVRAAGRLRLSSYERDTRVAPGDLVDLVVRLKRPRGTQNPGGFDFERFALERRYAATGYVRTWNARRHAQHAGVDAMRASASAWIARQEGDARIAGLLRALAVGDQAAIADRDWDVLRATGTTHLIAISGFHVGLVAGLGALLSRLLYALRPTMALRVPRRHAEAFGALLWACAYSLLAGLSLPVQRTLLMIAVVLVAVLTRRALRSSGAMALAMIALLLSDPLAVLGAGFWLSFAGVAFLILCLDGRRLREGVLRELGRAQLAMAVGLLPLGVWFFQQGSLVGPLANLVAIPWISFVVVPLLLLALLANAIWAAAGAALLALAAHALRGLWWLLERAASWPGAEFYLPEPGPLSLSLALLGGALLVLPRAVPARALAPLLFLPLLLPPLDAPARSAFDVITLDVGQGLAVLVRTERHALVYDAGARFPGGFDHGDAAVVPALRALGIKRLDALVVSHADNDHAGGAASVVQAMQPLLVLRGPDVELAGQSCESGLRWQWDGVSFELLHPPRGFPSLGNDGSCVLRVSSGAASALLAGDISSAIEQRLVDARAPLSSDVLLVPHHGSKSSSSADFLAAASPSLGVVSAGYRNRFGHPAPAVLERYASVEAAVRSTIDDGALRVRLDPHGGIAAIASRRDDTKRYWRER